MEQLSSLTNSLAKGINLDGGNNKISFRKLQLYRVYQGNYDFNFLTFEFLTFILFFDLVIH